MHKDLTCFSSDSLAEVMRIINDNCKGVCFVLDDDSRLIGTVTDGDIRRSLLSGVSINDDISSSMNKSFVFGFENESQHDLVKKLSNEITIIPIVDVEMKLLDVFTLDNKSYYPVSMPNLNGRELLYLTDAFLSSWISSQGEYLERFEIDFAKFCQCDYGVAVSNGTAALHLALLALDIGPGDEVIIPDLTFAATANAVLHSNARPVIVDIEEDSWCIDPKSIERAISSKTKAIIPVHLYGQPCNMGEIMSIAKRNNLFVIEDCAEAHGATFEGQKVGSFGDIGCFSFYGNKVITTGEGGMCVTNSVKLREKMILFKNHGMDKEKRYWHEVIGYNYRMTNIQAALGVAQLERIDNILSNRRQYETAYREAFLNHDVLFQKDIPGRNRITWLTSLLLNSEHDKDVLFEILKNNGIDARQFFYPLSEMPIYREYVHKEVIISKKISKLGINLPTYESKKSILEIQKILNKIL